MLLRCHDETYRSFRDNGVPVIRREQEDGLVGVSVDVTDVTSSPELEFIQTAPA
jgi:hypothetical protein